MSYAFPIRSHGLILDHILLHRQRALRSCQGMPRAGLEICLATSLVPPSLMEGMVLSAIQRRTVLIAIPVSCGDVASAQVLAAVRHERSSERGRVGGLIAFRWPLSQFAGGLSGEQARNSDQRG